MLGRAKLEKQGQGRPKVKLALGSHRVFREVGADPQVPSGAAGLCASLQPFPLVPAPRADPPAGRTQLLLWLSCCVCRAGGCDRGFLSGKLSAQSPDPAAVAARAAPASTVVLCWGDPSLALWPRHRPRRGS